jgi:hypothetical protein
MDLAKTNGLEMNVELIFPTKCCVITKQYERTMRTMNTSHLRNHLKSSIFLIIVVDLTITSLKNKFEELKTFESNFEFLYD